MHGRGARAQYLYSSGLCQTFLKNPFTQQFDLAKRKPAERGETIRILLESVSLGSAEHVALVFAHTLDDEAKPLVENWSPRRSSSEAGLFSAATAQALSR